MNDILVRMKKILGVSSDLALSKKLHLTNGVVGNWRARNSTPYSACEKIATEHGISLDWLLLGKGEPYLNPQINNNNPLFYTNHSATQANFTVGEKAATSVYTTKTSQNNTQLQSEVVNIPKYDIKGAQTGDVFKQQEAIVSRVAFSSNWIHKIGIAIDNLAIIEATNNAMEPLINNGDQVMLDLSCNTMSSDAMYLVRLDQCLLIKHLQQKIVQENSLTLPVIEVSSSNPRYKPFTLHNNNNNNNAFEIIGQVIWSDRIWLNR